MAKGKGKNGKKTKKVEAADEMEAMAADEAEEAPKAKKGKGKGKSEKPAAKGKKAKAAKADDAAGFNIAVRMAGANTIRGNVSVDGGQVVVNYKKPRSSKRIDMVLPLNSKALLGYCEGEEVDGDKKSGGWVLLNGAFDALDETFTDVATADGVTTATDSAGRTVVFTSNADLDIRRDA